jgi:phage gp45-like
MNDGIVKQLACRLRNLFSLGEFQKRYSDGKIQVKTIFGRVIEKKEAFPYGFKAKAKKGDVLVFCQGGNFDGFELLPVLDYEGGPELQEGDAALYTASGVLVICRDDGSVEIKGTTGDITIQKTGEISVKGSAVAIQEGGLPAARQTDPVQSTPADDPAFWGWVTSIGTALQALGYPVTAPTMLMSKITAGSATVTIG